MIHQLKTESKYFDQIRYGHKTFEVRKNDRNFKVGDYLGLNRVPDLSLDDSPLGRMRETLRMVVGIKEPDCMLVEVLGILDDPAYVKDGYVIMSIGPCLVMDAEAAE